MSIAEFFHTDHPQVPLLAPPAPLGTALRLVARAEQFDRVGSRRPGTRLRFHVYAGAQFLVTHDSRRAAERHVAGRPVIESLPAGGFRLWRGAQSAFFLIREDARREARGKGADV